MNAIKTTIFVSAITLAATLARADLVRIGGVTFDQNNSAKTAMIVEGPVTLANHSNKEFGRYSEEYLTSPESRANSFRGFDRGKSVGRLLGRYGGDLARHISFPSPSDNFPGAGIPNVHRCGIELTWGENGLPNGSGPDFAVYEAGTWEGFAVAVRKAGSGEFTGYRYHFPNAADKYHGVNVVSFDLSKFGLAEGETISAIRIRNVFNSRARGGGDKVDQESGEGWVIYPGDPRYKEAYMLREKPAGAEFPLDRLGADIVYVVGLQNVVPLKSQNAAAPAPAVAPVAATEQKDASQDTAKKQ